MPKKSAKTPSPSAGKFRESATAKKKRSAEIVQLLAKTYGQATCALHHRSPFELLAATILSAQCTDERVNLVTPQLFQKFPTPAALAMASQSAVEKIIHSTGFYRAKAGNLIGMAKRLVDVFQGELPRTIDELVTLPGVGRKTANVVLGTCFGIASGVVVDTHVKRLSTRLGLTDKSSPEQIESDLMSLLPESEWILFSHRLIHHGRQICDARKPKCDECPLLQVCPQVGVSSQK